MPRHGCRHYTPRYPVRLSTRSLAATDGSTVGQALLEHKDVAAISFTGSVATGRRIAEACIASGPMKKMQLEMGGKNPMVVLDDADLKTAVFRIRPGEP
jgi:acyl-CoA reductase-like NAD-dependent aldehyde dehydrogenase